MFGSLLQRARIPGLGAIHPSFLGLRLERQREGHGFDMGIVLSKGGDKATIGVEVMNVDAATADLISRWQELVHAEETVVSTASSVRVGATGRQAVLWVTVAVRDKAERRSKDDFLTRLARFTPAVYSCADSLGLDTFPLSAEGIGTWAHCAIFDSESSFPPRVNRVTDLPQVLATDGVYSCSFEFFHGRKDSEADFLDVLQAVTTGVDQLAAVSQGDFHGYITWWARPSVDDPRQARWVGVVGLQAKSHPELESGAYYLIEGVDPRHRLRLRRMWNRQAMGLGAALGAGVLGWERLDVTK